MKKVIVLMATYNGEKFVEEQINSIINQDYPCFVSILDDCSTDKTYNVLEKTTKNLTNFSLRQNNINNGIPGANFFKLLKENINERYDYFSFSDQDDFWEKDKISRAVQLLDSTNSDFYCSELNLWNGNKVFSKTNKKGSIKENDHIFQSASAGCTCVISRDLAEKIVTIIDDKKFVYWENFSHDWFMYFITRVNGFNFIIDDESKINYRIHANNAFSTLSIFKPQTFILRIKLMNNRWYKKNLENMLQYTHIHSKDYQIMNSVLSGSFLERLSIVLKHGKEFRRNFSHRIVLQLAILLNKI